MERAPASTVGSFLRSTSPRRSRCLAPRRSPGHLHVAVPALELGQHMLQAPWACRWPRRAPDQAQVAVEPVRRANRVRFHQVLRPQSTADIGRQWLAETLPACGFGSGHLASWFETAPVGTSTRAADALQCAPGRFPMHPGDEPIDSSFGSRDGYTPPADPCQASASMSPPLVVPRERSAQQNTPLPASGARRPILRCSPRLRCWRSVPQCL